MGRTGSQILRDQLRTCQAVGAEHHAHAQFAEGRAVDVRPMIAPGQHAIGAACPPIHLEPRMAKPYAFGIGKYVFTDGGNRVACRRNPALKRVSGIGFVVRLGGIGQHPGRVAPRCGGQARVGCQRRHHR